MIGGPARSVGRPSPGGAAGRDNAVVQSAYEYIDVIRPPRLRAGDHVRLVSPGSAPSPAEVSRTTEVLTGLGLRVSVGSHALELPGPDADRVEDINQALRDTGIRALIAVGGGRGAHRIADDLDFAAAAAFPKLLAGAGTTILHLVLWERSGLSGVYGSPFDESFAAAVTSTDPAVLASRVAEPTAALTTTGRASGVLLGGDQDMVAMANGWALPSLHGAILLLDGHRLRPGDVDRQLTMLHRAGRLGGVRGVAVGRYAEAGPEVLDDLRERLGALGVPVLGGLPTGVGAGRVAIPVGAPAVLDADAGTLTVESAVR